MKSTLQKAYSILFYVATGILGLGSALDALSNAISLLSFSRSVYLSSTLLILWATSEIFLRIHPVRWMTSDGQSIHIHGLGTQQRMALVGAIFLLWLPTVVGPSKTTTPLPEPIIPPPRSITTSLPRIPRNIDSSVRKIVFASTQLGIEKIFTIDSNGGNRQQLTYGNQIDSDPVWSPDGTHIAFMSNRGGNYDVYVMDADGSNLRRLTTDPCIDGQPSWGPGGKFLIFSSNRSSPHPPPYCSSKNEWAYYQIYKLNLSDLATQQLTFDDRRGHRAPAWSPDGTKIALQAKENYDWDIYIMQDDGRNLRSLVHSNKDDTTPSWSSDSEAIVFASGQSLVRDIYTIGVDGSNLKRVTYDGSNNSSPAWSDDGRITYQSKRDDNWDIYIVNSDGSNLHNVTSSKDSEVTPSWQFATQNSRSPVQ